MVEIVYTETYEKNRGLVDSMDYGRAILDDKVTIFQSRDKVSLVTSNLIVGVPRGRDPEANKNKRYYYWRSVESYGFRRNRAGNVMPFQCRRPWDATVGVHWQHQQARDPFLMLAERADWALANEFRRAVRTTFGVEKPSDIYPMMDEYGLFNYITIPNSLKVAFRERSFDDLTRVSFGKTRTTPRLVAAVANTDPYIVAYAQQFRGLVDNEKIVKFIEDNHFDDEMEEGFRPHSPDIRHGLLAAPKKLLDALISNQMDLSDMNRVRYLTGVGKYSMKSYFNRRGSEKLRNLTELIGR